MEISQRRHDEGRGGTAKDAKSAKWEGISPLSARPTTAGKLWRAGTTGTTRRRGRYDLAMARISWKRLIFTVLAGEFCVLGMFNWAFGLMALGHGIGVFWDVTFVALVVTLVVALLIELGRGLVGWVALLGFDAWAAIWLLSEIFGRDRYQNVKFLASSPTSLTFWIVFLVALHVVFVVSSRLRWVAIGQRLETPPETP
jgi:hypothetical protein